MSTLIEAVFGGANSGIHHINTDATYTTVLTAGWAQTIDPTYLFRQGDLVIATLGANTTPVLLDVSIDVNGVVSLLPRSDLFSVDVVVTAAALASGGAVTLMPSIPSQQFKIRGMQLNSGGTNFSGGGGDRLGQVTDGTTVYSVIPAATMQSLANAQWGVTALPNPASAAINTSSVAGAALVFKYSGGTADYSTGSLTITLLLQRVA